MLADLKLVVESRLSSLAISRGNTDHKSYKRLDLQQQHAKNWTTLLLSSCWGECVVVIPMNMDEWYWIANSLSCFVAMQIELLCLTTSVLYVTQSSDSCQNVTSFRRRRISQEISGAAKVITHYMTKQLLLLFIGTMQLLKTIEDARCSTSLSFSTLVHFLVHWLPDLCDITVFCCHDRTVDTSSSLINYWYLLYVQSSGNSMSGQEKTMDF